MKLSLRTLTPVHIGSGAEIPPSEYWYDGKSRQVRRLNLASLSRDPDFLPHLEKFVAEAAQARQIQSFVPQEVLRKHIRYSITAAPNPPYPIKAQVQSGGRLVIPGSSVKGSLLSAVLWRQLRNLSQDRPDLRAQIEKALSESNNKQTGRLYNDLLAVALGSFCGQADNRFLKWLSVSDSNLLPASGNMAVVLVQVAGTKKDLPALMEVIRSGVTVALELDQPQGGCQNRTPTVSIEEVLATADSFYRRVWQKTQTQPPPTGGWLVRLGQGSGAWATSLLLLADDLQMQHRYQVKPPKTRKLINGTESLGWVLLAPWTGNERLGSQQEESRQETKSPEEKGAPVISAPPPETWPKANLSWRAQDGTVVVTYQGKTALGKGKEIIPEDLVSRICAHKAKPMTVAVSVEHIGGKNYRLIKIHEKS